MTPSSFLNCLSRCSQTNLAYVFLAWYYVSESQITFLIFINYNLFWFSGENIWGLKIHFWSKLFRSSWVKDDIRITLCSLFVIIVWISRGREFLHTQASQGSWIKTPSWSLKEGKTERFLDNFWWILRKWH